ncbi:MAG: MFS transporter [Thermoleophilia bacterium]|nr:MFS transporter [Thermoleophilia bacterium]
MAARLREMWRTPAGRGFIMLAVMSAAFGFALNAHNNLVTNYFEEILHFNGPEFGYITAIREVGGFLLIFLTALLYRISLQRLTAGALVALALGYGLYGLSHSFWTVVPWVVITSFGFHTVMQTQYSLGMSLTTEAKSGSILGRMNAFGQAGTFAALIMVFLLFHFRLLSFRPTFVVLGVVAFIGACAIVGFPHLHEGQARKTAPKREPIVLRRAYRYYYVLSLLDSARQQVFFSFGLWVLVNHFGLSVSQISLLLLAVTFASMISSAWVGRMIDKHGERRVLSIINLAYIAALAGYALAGNVFVACFCYLVYAFIYPVSPIAASTYLRKIALPEEVAPSLAMGVTLSHATAIVVPVAAGFILNFVGYQIPFFIGCGFALVTFLVTFRLDPVAQRCPARIAADAARAAASVQTATGNPPPHF